MDLAPGINHLVILCMENRSFDHYLGALALEGRQDVDGLSAPLPQPVRDASGNAVAHWQMDQPNAVVNPAIPDVPHSWGDMHADWGGGNNDGFVKSFQADHEHDNANLAIPMGYYTRQTLSALYSLADEFVVCNRWFASILSSTWPNRKFLHSGAIDSDRDTQIIPGLAGFRTNPIYTAIAQTRGLSWRCYFTDLPFLSFWYGFAFRNIRNFELVDAFARDCVQGTLPTISIVDPPFTLASDHPPQDPLLGEKFIGLIVDALTNSPSWHDTVLLVVYDEAGGFYDHVPPPNAPEANPPDKTLGFRVPALLIGPTAKKRYASNVVYDQTSVMASIASQWKVAFGVTDYGTRWSSANTFWQDADDQAVRPRPLGTYTGEPITSVTWGTGVRDRLESPLGTFETALERIFVLPELKALDRRAQAFDTLGNLESSVIALKRSTDYETSLGNKK